MKMLKRIFIISILFYSNCKTLRDPFQFKHSEKQTLPSGPRYKVIGYGKSGDGTKFVVVENGFRTETITPENPNWALYAN